MKTEHDISSLKKLLKNSLEVIEHLRQKKELSNVNHSKIAIIGMSCRFPDGCDTPEKFWEFLISKKVASKMYPESRYNKTGIKIDYSARYLEDVTEFDPLFFGISPKEANEMDPQQRMILLTVWEAAERAGYYPKKIGNDVGVFVGVIGSEFGRLAAKASYIGQYIATGTLASLVSGRVSFLLDYQGPTVSIDTACSASLIAVYEACEALRHKKCQYAFAGGVNLLFDPDVFKTLDEMNALSKDGQCKTLSDKADGYGRAEGCGVILLKRLEDALEDMDNIIAVIDAIETNHDGKSGGLTVPNGQAQRKLFNDVLANSSLSPKNIGYIELHGTGTPLGDPIEVEAILDVYGQDRTKENPLFLGSLKTNIGHLEGAAGIAGIIKIALMLQNKKIPPHQLEGSLSAKLNINGNAIIPLGESPNNFLSNAAAVSSFGFSGSNAHAILTTVQQKFNVNNTPGKNSYLFCISAKNVFQLISLLKKYISYLKERDDIQSICYTTNLSKTFFPEKFSCVIKNKYELIERINHYIENNTQGQRKKNAVSYTLSVSDLSENIQFCEIMTKNFSVYSEFLIESAKQISYCPDHNKWSQDETNKGKLIQTHIRQYAWLRFIDACLGMPSDIFSIGVSHISSLFFVGLLKIDEVQAIIEQLSKQEFNKLKEFQIKADTLNITIGDKIQIETKKRRVNLVKSFNNTDKDINIEKINNDEIIHFILTKFSQFYVYGIDLRWNQFYKGEKYVKVILPTYPFNLQTYWTHLCASTKTTDPYKILKKIPLPINDNFFDVTQVIAAYPDVEDTHNIVHIGIYIDLISHIISNLEFKAGFILQICDIRFRKALVFKKKLNHPVIFRLFEADSSYFYEIYSINNLDSNQWNIYSTGKIGFFLDNNSLKFIPPEYKYYEKHLSGIDFYRKMESIGIVLGSSVRCLDNIYILNNSSCVAEINAINNLPLGGNIPCHASILDCCAQLFHALTFSETNSKKYMVTQIEKLIIFKKNYTSKFLCYLELKQALNENYLLGDFFLFDHENHLLITGKNCEMKAVAMKLSKITEEYKIDSTNIDQDDISTVLIKSLCSLLEINDLSMINVNEALTNYGIDSLTASAYKETIYRLYKVDIPLDELISGKNIANLVENIKANIPKKKVETQIKIHQNPYSLDVDLWIKNKNIIDTSQFILYCLPYGGGGALLYQNWANQLKNFIHVCPIQLPGREERLFEKPESGLEPLVNYLTDAIRTHADRPFAIYGHSFGALIGYGVSINMRGNPLLKALFPAAFTAPSADKKNPWFSSLQENFSRKNLDFMSILHQINDLNDLDLDSITELLSIPNTLSPSIAHKKMLLRILINDIYVVESSRLRSDTKIDIPIYAFYGLRDDRVTQIDMENWKNLTSNSFNLKCINGDHLFINDNALQKKLLDSIASILRSFIVNV